ncbi:MAG: DUF421 domain-containing protein [Alicyclobacillus herbarius]|uniref:DUF421 domain-containing protein n=1 Tax=Alicyclobacillus herbarius TaxID=122960 RepID=UPI00041E773D|nr:DUF421 domain-containing protein [Alicyclobacillus herbarius]MCL6633747.1 DUF421 domain-containing protein [Alicyclobacillus herbarius]
MPQVIEVAAQSIVAFIVLFILARLMGKRQIAQLTFFDYVAGITIGNIAASFSLDDTKVEHAVISLIIWTALTILLAVVQRKWYRVGLLLDGKPIVIIKNGQVQEQNLKKINLSHEEMLLLLREKDIFNLSDVEYAVMENNGRLSVMKKPDLNPLTPRDLGMIKPPEVLPQMVIRNGKVLEKTLHHMGYSKDWLLAEIRKQGANNFADVAIAQFDSAGNLVVDLYHDAVAQPQVKAKPLVLANLKKIQADLEMFALQTQNEEAKQQYAEMAKTLQETIDKLTPHLRE